LLDKSSEFQLYLTMHQVRVCP